MTETGRTLSEEYAEADLYGRRELLRSAVEVTLLPRSPGCNGRERIVTEWHS